MSDIKKNFDINSDIDIDRLARLCRLYLSDEEKARGAEELKKMADYTYPRVRTEDASLPFSYCRAERVLRDDEVIPTDSSIVNDIVALSASARDGYVAVPKIIKEEDK